MAGEIKNLAASVRQRLYNNAKATGTVSSFIANKLDAAPFPSDTGSMRSVLPSTSRSVSATVRRRIEQGGERLWRIEDFSRLPFTAVAQTLSRLTRKGQLQRLSKGVYYRFRQTAFGPSLPNPAAVQKLASRRKRVFPSGISAANLLGFTTQSGSKGEVATNSLSLPRKLIGDGVKIHTRRPEAWAALSDEDAAILDFLRRKGAVSELTAQETIRRILALISEKKRFERLLKVAYTEPPRVRAMLGAIGEHLNKSQRSLRRLKASLNPLSRFDFGVLTALDRAHNWQAKEQHSREAT